MTSNHDTDGNERAMVASGTVEVITEFPRPGTQSVVQINNSQRELLRRTVAEKASDDQLELFLAYALRAQLDPFTRQIYCAIDNNGRMSILAGIDGLRLSASRTGFFLGSTTPEWCDEDGVWKDVWLKQSAPAAAKVGVIRQMPGGTTQTTYRVAIFKEFNRPTQQTWQRMPAHMLAVRAESHALRAAFPNELGGIYTADEMDDGSAYADNEPPRQIESTSHPTQQQQQQQPATKTTRARSGTSRTPANNEPVPPQTRDQLGAAQRRAETDEEMKALGDWIREQGVQNAQIMAVLNTTQVVTLNSLRDHLQSNNISIATFKETLMAAVKTTTASVDTDAVPDDLHESAAVGAAGEGEGGETEGTGEDEPEQLGMQEVL